MPLIIRQIGPGDADALERILAIYREAIEPSEQRPETTLRTLPGRSDYQVLVAERDGEIAGFAVSYAPPAEDFWLFEYAATLPAERGRGVGATLFRHAQMVAGETRTALVEADAERNGEDLTRRRLQFYARLGARKVQGLDYLLPLRTHGVPPPMVLLAFALQATDSVPVATLERWLQRLYADVYGQSPSDPRIKAMLTSLPPDVPLVLISPAPPTP